MLFKERKLRSLTNNFGDFEKGRFATATVSGAAGAGILSNLSRLSKLKQFLAAVATDTALSAGSQAILEHDVDMGEALLAGTFGAIGGGAGTYLLRGKVQNSDYVSRMILEAERAEHLV